MPVSAIAKRLLLRALWASLVVFCVVSVMDAQIPGRNVNMVSGLTWPNGDPFLQRQNEPSVAASTRNPLHLLAGANDYRTVDLPGLPGADVTGDAWLGLFKSFDGGQRWISNLIPGYPQDHSSVGMASPLKGYDAAADPVVRAGTNGLFYYAGLAFNRGDNGRSAVFVARFVDNNNLETGDPVAYAGTSIVSFDPGTTGRFLDKPWLAVDIPRGAAATCHVVTPGPDGTSVAQDVPAGPAYVVFSAFTGSGDSLASDIMFAYSTDCGVTWSAPVSLTSKGPDDGLNQGATIAIDPRTGNVYVAWRRFSRPGSNDTDAIMVARSVNFGRKFEPAKSTHQMPKGHAFGEQIHEILEHRHAKGAVDVEDLSQFDQATSAAGLTFRTNAYPTLTFDDQGRLYMAWSERGHATDRPDPVTGDARILIASSSNGVSWTDPQVVSETGQPGHQLMPTLGFAGGKLLLVYYDLREDVSQIFSQYVDDQTSTIAAHKRHTIDIRAALGQPGATPVFQPAVQVSSYLMGDAVGGQSLRQLQYNPPNLPMFQSGTVPFMGDYIDLSPSPAFVLGANGRWAYNTSADAVPVFHAVWTDNRDVRAPMDGNWQHYTPPVLSSGTSTFDPTQMQPACIATQTGSRNQNVYSARITGGLVVGSPGNAKTLSTTLQRGFVVFAQNTTSITRSFRLQIVNQPAGGRASFDQFPLPPYDVNSPPPLLTLDVVTPPFSMAVRTVYVTSTDPHAQVIVDVAEIAGPGAPAPVPGGLDGNVVINPDVQNPDIQNPDVQNPDIQNPDIQNEEVTNPDIQNPDIQNPDIQNPDIQNPDIQNPDIQNITVVNPDIQNPDVQNPDIQNPDIQNPDIQNPDIQNQSLTDVTWTVTNNGNTTSGFNVNLFLNQTTLPNGLQVQLVLFKTYTTPTTDGCELKYQTQNVLVDNILNPSFVDPTAPTLPDPNRPDADNATLWLAPGESGKITLRILDPDTSNNVIVDGHSIDPALLPAVTVRPAVVPQAVDTDDARNDVTEPPVTTGDQSTIFFVQQPPQSPMKASAGVPIAPAVRVQVRDTSGAVLPGVIVQLSLAAGPTGATLSGAGAPTDASGIATFPDLAVSLPGSGYRLSASVVGDAGLAPASSTQFDAQVAVVNTADSGPGSLRNAIQLATATPEPDTIVFNIPGPAPHTIAIQSQLPDVVNTTIDGMTQPDYAGQPSVVLDGEAAPAETSAFQLNGSSSTIRGLEIVRFGATAIRVIGSGGNAIDSNYLGTDALGTAGLGNQSGVDVLGSSNNVITNNVVSGNTQNGIVVEGGSANRIDGNLIGTTSDGLSGLPNGTSGTWNGITIFGSDVNTPADGLVIANNVIAANTSWGIETQLLSGATAGATNLQILDNRVGLGTDGSAIPNAQGGVHLNGTPGAVVGAAGHGNVVSGNGGTGLTIDGANAGTITVKSNLIGTDPSGMLPRGNAAFGIVVTAPNVTIGWQTGDTGAVGNLISGNGADGIQVLGGSASGVVIAGNLIGTNITGNAALSAGMRSNYQGIYVNGAGGTVIGGATAAARNVLAGNMVDGVYLDTAGTHDVMVQNNYIGVGADGATAIANGWDGVGLIGALDNVVSGNVISGNGLPLAPRYGIYISSAGNQIDGNYIGTDATGTLAVPNLASGIFAGGNDTSIGQTSPNTIAFNSGAGISVLGTGNRIVSNHIWHNGQLGIDLGADNEVAANDSGDGDEGANDLQNYPVISNATNDIASPVTTVEFSLHSTPNSLFTIQFFANDACDASGNGEGQRLVGSFSATTDGNGNAPGTAMLDERLLHGTVITATATDGAGNTSEFSPCFTLQTGVFLWSAAQGGNNHYYEYVSVPGSWSAANTAAQGRTFEGTSGHLVTIANAAENAFVTSLQLADLRAWIGLTDAASEGTFHWVTGEPLLYMNWAAGEPNNGATVGAPENWVEIFASGRWNDALDSGPPQPPNQGYLVEYEPAH